MLIENPVLSISPCEILNLSYPAYSPEGSFPFHSCLETLDHWTETPRGINRRSSDQSCLRKSAHCWKQLCLRREKESIICSSLQFQDHRGLERWVQKGSTPAHMEGPLPFNTFYPHSRQGTRAHDSWIRCSGVKLWKKTEEDTQYTCEPLGDLWYPFRTPNEFHCNEEAKIKFWGINFIRRALASAWATLLSLCLSQGNSLALRQTPL